MWIRICRAQSRRIVEFTASSCLPAARAYVLQVIQSFGAPVQQLMMKKQGQFVSAAGFGRRMFRESGQDCQLRAPLRRNAYLRDRWGSMFSPLWPVLSHV